MVYSCGVLASLLTGYRVVFVSGGSVCVEEQLATEEAASIEEVVWTIPRWESFHVSPADSFQGAGVLYSSWGKIQQLPQER